MSKPLFSYPGESAGIALLFLRMSVSLLPIAIELFFGPFPRWWVGVGYAGAACLTLGLLTRPVSFLCAAATIEIALARSDTLGWMLLLHVLDMLALTALGAGAYSIDGWLYGRRVVRL